MTVVGRILACLGIAIVAIGGYRLILWSSEYTITEAVRKGYVAAEVEASIEKEAMINLRVLPDGAGCLARRALLSRSRPALES
jgi:hypothetical protein